MAASYKVPQDVEAEDKLIGPFSFRQFIYLGIVAMAIAAAWGLFLLFPLLAVIPVPIVIFFGALALPLRKDQPMETYLAAMWQFYVKPRQRMWMADGVVSRISIDIPIVIERQLTKNLTNDQALSQFDYLSQVADTGGWSTRGVAHAPLAVVDNPADDILDSSSSIAQRFDSRLQREDDQRREELLAKVHSGVIIEEAPVQAPVAPVVAGAPAIAPEPQATYVGPAPVYNPAPQYMQQHVIQPVDPTHKVKAPTAAPIKKPAPKMATKPAPKPAEPVATPAHIDAIMELAKGVSVETVAKQLHHEEVERHGDEVIIKLH